MKPHQWLLQTDPISLGQNAGLQLQRGQHVRLRLVDLLQLEMARERGRGSWPPVTAVTGHANGTFHASHLLGHISKCPRDAGKLLPLRLTHTLALALGIVLRSPVLYLHCPPTRRHALPCQFLGVQGRQHFHRGLIIRTPAPEPQRPSPNSGPPNCE